jgi:hypothetical protein
MLVRASGSKREEVQLLSNSECAPLQVIMSQGGPSSGDTERRVPRVLDPKGDARARAPAGFAQGDPSQKVKVGLVEMSRAPSTRRAVRARNSPSSPSDSSLVVPIIRRRRSARASQIRRAPVPCDNSARPASSSRATDHLLDRRAHWAPGGRLDRYGSASAQLAPVDRGKLLAPARTTASLHGLVGRSAVAHSRADDLGDPAKKRADGEHRGCTRSRW